MISLKKREHISVDSIAVASSIGDDRPGVALPGLFLLTLFILSFCCRFSQAALLYGMHIAGPTSDWEAPSAFLLLLPSAVVAFPAGRLAARLGRPLTFLSLAFAACVLALVNLLLGTGMLPGIVMVSGLVLISAAFETGRLSILSQVADNLPKKNAHQASVNLVFCELATTALAVTCFRTAANTVALSELIRLIGLVLISASFLFYLLKQGQNVADDEQLDLSSGTTRLSSIKIAAMSVISLAAASNTTILALLSLTIGQRAVALVPVYTFWSAAAIGAIAGCLFCLWRIKSEQQNWYLTFAISCCSAVICVLKPEGQTLFTGMVLSGFAASVANISCCTQIIKWRRIITPGTLFGIQAAVLCSIALVIGIVVEPKAESISCFVFIRIIAIAQFLLLIISGTISYIDYKYARARS